MGHVWEVDEGTEVRLKGFGGKRLFLNGQEIAKIKGRQHTFALADGRSAELEFKTQLVGFDVVLRVKGEMVAPSSKYASKTCPQCASPIRPFNRFCNACGATLPRPELVHAEVKAKEGASAIGALAILFVIAGLFTFYVTLQQATTALASLEGRAADEVISVPGAVDRGQPLKTVGELRQEIQAEPVGVLVLNLFLAAVMAGLWVWGRRNPFPAIVIALATYLAVIVGNAIVSPASLASGLLVKLIVLTYLFRGLKAALALRAARAAPTELVAPSSAGT